MHGLRCTRPTPTVVRVRRGTHSNPGLIDLPLLDSGNVGHMAAFRLHRAPGAHETLAVEGPPMLPGETWAVTGQQC